MVRQVATYLRQELGHLDVPVIIAGDFNSLSIKKKPDMIDKLIPEGGLDSGVYTLLSQGILHPDHADHPYTRQSCTPISMANSSHDAASLAKVPLTSSGLKLSSVHQLSHGWEPPLTTKTTTFAGCLDYIWLSHRASEPPAVPSSTDTMLLPEHVGPSSCDVTDHASSQHVQSHFKVLHTLELPYSMSRWKNVEVTGGGSSGVKVAAPVWIDPLTDIDFPAIPNQSFPSDHLAMGCELELIVPPQIQKLASSI
ncbi:hypothetical protein CEUSTIGMA_g6656.t1 [Chlamydomonas eustigma]|uniref:Uncharacterized protein n=1 Tax=Chlamydomonas eustigma TaxID=1157962 RepID=A0A250X834_9CHLO|nr:hypothetical protein CEUSTIGMA_g6656.t1 [Chlamydomonas eustigma]|eukprot:GAX79216.1 hypothetical protein CEUSTIGMA_g6656.t1 [Chlamydomonas eustigma]